MTEPLLNEARLEAIREAMTELRAEYAAVLPGLIRELDEAAQAACASADEGELRHVRTLVHRLRGAAGSYGFKRVSEAAAVMEDLLYERETARAPLDAATRDAALAALAALAAVTADELAAVAPASAPGGGADEDGT